MIPHKYIAIAAMTLSLGSTSALAQTAQTEGTTGTTAPGMQQHEGMPSEWEGSIGDAFYSDAELGLLRSDEEMRTNWEGMSDEDQDAVRDYCEQFAMDDDRPMLNGDTGMGTGTGTGTGMGAGTETGTGVGTGTDTGVAGTDTGTGVGTETDTGVATDTGTGVGTETDTGVAGTDTGTGVGTGTGTEMGTGAADPAADMHQASIRQICDMIEDDNDDA